MAENKYAKMSLEALTKINQRLGAQSDEIQAERAKIRVEMDKQVIVENSERIQNAAMASRHALVGQGAKKHAVAKGSVSTVKRGEEH